MDVDRLRPGTVPLAPETVLWFEFLLDPSLLEKHLSKPNPDPSPTDLIIKFLSVDKKEETIILDEANEETESHSPAKITKRSLAIKILTLKVMTFLNWDLDILESKLPLPMQVTLLHDLLYIAIGEDIPIHNHINMDLSTLDHQTVFAISMYHRWVLKSYVCGALVLKQPRVPFIPVPGLQDPNLIAANQREEIRTKLAAQINDSLEICNRVLKLPCLIVPVLNSFIHIKENTTDVQTKWLEGVTVKSEELKCQLHYELGSFNFFKEEYALAKENFSLCHQLFEQLKSDPSLKSDIKFCNIEEDKLDGYCQACGIPSKTDANLKALDLYDQFKASLMNNYAGLMQILQADNEAHVIPLNARELLEMEIQVAMSSGNFTVAKDLLLKVQILNTLRRASTREIYYYLDFLQCLRNNKDKGIEFFLESLKSLLSNATEDTRQNLKFFLLDLMLKDLAHFDRFSTSFATIFLADETLKSLFSGDEIRYLEQKVGIGVNEINEVLSKSHNDITIHLILKSPRLEIMKIQQQLIQSNETTVIKDLLQKLCSKDPAKSWWKLNNKWDLPIPLQSVVMSLPKGFLQDFVYILLAKSRELSNIKDFKKAILLLETTAKEIKESKNTNSNTIYKLNRLLEWEILLVQINHYLEEYTDNTIYPAQLISSCKSCLAAIQSGDSVIPRLEIMENCALALLNLGEWEILTSMDKRWTYLELAAAIAYACQDVTKHKGSKKISRDSWDLVLPVFGQTTQNKRSTGSAASPTNSALTKNCLVNFLLRLREPTCLTVVISLLARLHNVLKDEPNLEITCQYIGLWPAVISNSNSYSSRSVAEVLTQVTLQALKFMPKHGPFLKVLGDLNYVMSDWASALRYYLEAGAVASDFFSQPVPKTHLDDFTYKRMIKCCTQLQCHTQAAVFCQFLDEVDYSCAFKSLSEMKNSHSADAMDAYYPCIWDLTILEYLINLHNKRGENQRKQQVIKLIGLLELNSNNNEEIQREAANIRKRQFLRAMTNQYSISANINSFFVKN